MTTISQLREVLAGADSVGKKKNGTVMIRRGYFYRNGMNADSFLESVVQQLNNKGIKVEVVDFGDVWKPFRGSASVSRSSHWFVEVKLI
jgi:hypothetical protein